MKWLMRLYPRRWRERYGEEFTVLLEQANGGWPIISSATQPTPMYLPNYWAFSTPNAALAIAPWNQNLSSIAASKIGSQSWKSERSSKKNTNKRRSASPPERVMDAAAAQEGCGVDPITSGLYEKQQKAGIPEEAILASLGCGNPLPLLN